MKPNPDNKYPIKGYIMWTLKNGEMKDIWCVLRQGALDGITDITSYYGG